MCVIANVPIIDLQIVAPKHVYQFLPYEKKKWKWESQVL